MLPPPASDSSVVKNSVLLVDQTETRPNNELWTPVTAEGLENIPRSSSTPIPVDASVFAETSAPQKETPQETPLAPTPL